MDRFLKPLVFGASLLPLLWLAWRAEAGELGANPIEAVNRFLGDWALRFLLASLAITPLKGLTGKGYWMRYRRMLGLFAFFYAVLHAASYIGLDQFFDWQAIGDDILKRRYITVGMLALLGLIPLAATSPKAVARRLGGRRWQALHRSVYGIAVLAVLHFAMMVKADLAEPLLYAGVLALLLGWRVARRLNAWRSSGC